MVSHTDALLFAFFFHLSCGIPDPKKYLTVMVVQSKLDVKIQAFFSVFFTFIYKIELMPDQRWLLDSVEEEITVNCEIVDFQLVLLYRYVQCNHVSKCYFN